MAAELSPWETPERLAMCLPDTHGLQRLKAQLPGVKEGLWEPHQAGRKANMDLCILVPLRIPYSHEGQISVPHSTSEPLYKLYLLLERPVFLPSLLFSYPSGLCSGIISSKDASLSPQPELSASSGSPPGLCLYHYDSDHPVL